jgi:BirA family biotin operon repressor/biotin-[acetyl-CoA-carboxylase] ligase
MDDGLMFMGREVRRYATLASTNDTATALATDARNAEGLAVVADVQDAGRGQRGRQWQSEPGANLLVSYLLRPTFLRADMQYDLSRCVALAVQATVMGTLADDEQQVRVKWPNDILVDGRKVAGILIETGMRGAQMSHAVCGIGLNVNQTTFEGVPHATSLRLATGRMHKVDSVLHDLSRNLGAQYLLLRQGRTDLIRSRYDAALYGKDTKVHVRIAGHMTTMMPLGTLPDGRLMCRMPDGAERTFMLHEVEWLLG